MTDMVLPPDNQATAAETMQHNLPSLARHQYIAAQFMKAASTRGATIVKTGMSLEQCVSFITIDPAWDSGRRALLSAVVQVFGRPPQKSGIPS